MAVGARVGEAAKLKWDPDLKELAPMLSAPSPHLSVGDSRPRSERLHRGKFTHTWMKRVWHAALVASGLRCHMHACMHAPWACTHSMHGPRTRAAGRIWPAP